MAVTEVVTGALVTAAKGAELVVDVTAPTSPSTGNIWIDTSGAIPITRVWDGAQWQQLPKPVYTRLWSKFGDNYSGVNYAGGNGASPNWKTLNSIQGLNIPLDCGFLWRIWAPCSGGGSRSVRLNINNGTQILGTAVNGVTTLNDGIFEVYVAPYSRAGYVVNASDGFQGIPASGIGASYCPNIITRVDVETCTDTTSTAVQWEQAYIINGLGV